MTSLPTLEVLDARSLNTRVHAAIPKAAGPDAQRRSATCLTSGSSYRVPTIPSQSGASRKRRANPSCESPFRWRSLRMRSPGVGRISCMECAGWFSFVACSSLIARCISLFGLFHVRQELQIHLSAGVLKRCQRVSVDFLTNWPQLFSYAPGLEQPDRLLDSREKSLVKMCLLHLNPLYSLRRNAVVHLVKAPRHTPPRGSIADFHGGTNPPKEGYGGGCATSRSIRCAMNPNPR